MSTPSDFEQPPERPGDEIRTDLVGDSYDVEPLLTAAEVGRILRLPVKSVYELPIVRIRLGTRRIRWRPRDVHEFIDRRVETQ